MRTSLALILVFFQLSVFAQVSEADLRLLAEPNQVPAAFKPRQVKFGLVQSNNFVAKYNPVHLVFASLMWVYQKGISPQLMAGCLYRPSCSAYSKQLIKEYGLLKGIPCTADRLTRCTRISATSFWPIQLDEHDKHVHEDVDYYSNKKK